MRGSDEELERLATEAENEYQAEWQNLLVAASLLTPEISTDDLLDFVARMSALPLPHREAVVHALKRSTRRSWEPRLPETVSSTYIPQIIRCCGRV